MRANLELDRSRRIRAELERNQIRLDQTQRLARMGSWEFDIATGRITASPQFARMLAMSLDEVHALDLETALTTLLYPEDRQRVADAFSAGAEGERISYEALYRTGDGHDVLMEVVGELVCDAAGNPCTLRGSLQDISARRRAELESTAAAAAREVAAREHQIAEELQAGLLPALDFDPDHLNVATYYRAGVEGTQVGGDWYDVIELGAGRTALVIGDVMGSGVRAAAVMSQLRSAIRAYARLDLSPADILELCDGAVRELAEDQIITCIYAVYDPFEHTLSFANAGHLPPLLAESGGQYRPLPAAGPPLGTGALTFATATVAMPPGTTLVLYTDGLVERRDRDIDDGIAILMRHLGGAGSPANIVPEDLVARMLPQGPDDDVAILLARVPLDAPRVSSARLPVGESLTAVARARVFVADTLARWDVEPGLARDAILLTSELVTNALRHGLPPAELRLRHTSDALMLEVSDAANFRPQRLCPGPEEERGRGLLLVSRMSYRWGIRPTPTGKSVWCVLRSTPRARAL